jgi:hypothetical protein
MEKNTDIKKAARQHLEMETFFSGGLMPKTKQAQQQLKQTRQAQKNAAAELEKVADEVGKCHRC